MSHPFRITLVNLCEESYGYGPGACEYLRAHLLSRDELADRIAVEVLFLHDVAGDEVASRVLASEPDLVGFSCYSWNLAASADASAAIRRRDPTLPIVWGGCSFAHFAQRHDWFSWWDCVDAIAIGFAERTLEGVVRRLMARPGRAALEEPLPGLAILRNGRLEVGPPPPPPGHLDELVSPYLFGTASRVPRPYIEMARGCIFQCSFCSDARGSRQGLFLRHSVERIAADVARVVSWPEAEWVDAGASTANITEEAFAEVCQGIKRGDPAGRLVYSFQLYPALVRPHHRELLDGIRVGKFLVGLQSTTPATFRPMRRGGRLEHLERAIELLRDVGPIYVSVILGLPGETLESFSCMFDELTQLEDAFISVHRLLVLPGTAMHTNHELLGLRFDPARYYRATASSHMTEGDLSRAQEHVIRGAESLGRDPHGRPRVDWTNFDVQRRAFDAP